jgi:hypothetical protein
MRAAKKEAAGRIQRMYSSHTRVPRTLDMEGFFVEKKAVDVSVPKCNLLVALATCMVDTDSSIFNGKVNDHLRRQIDAPLDNDLIEAFRVFCERRLGGHHMQGTWVLVTMPGCEEQTPHTDYDPRTFPGDDPASEVPYGAILGLQDNTRLVVWPGSHLVTRKTSPVVMATDKTIVSFDRGDVLFFRGDLVHAGAAAAGEAPNVRVHGYLDVPKVHRCSDVAYPVSMN